MHTNGNKKVLSSSTTPIIFRMVVLFGTTEVFRNQASRQVGISRIIILVSKNYVRRLFLSNK